MLPKCRFVMYLDDKIIIDVEKEFDTALAAFAELGDVISKTIKAHTGV